MCRAKEEKQGSALQPQPDSGGSHTARWPRWLYQAQGQGLPHAAHQPTITWLLTCSLPHPRKKLDVMASLQLNKSISHINTINFRSRGRELG